jgi:nitrogen fixation protein FixH
LSGKVKLALAAAMTAGLGAVVATIWIGAAVREETVVARPYEEGLGHDAEGRARAALGLAVRLVHEAPEAGAAPLAFTVADREGRPVEDAAVSVELSRPETSRDARTVPARAEGAGRYAADVAFPEPGPWDVRFDVRRGADRVRLERRVTAVAPCDLQAGPCTRPLPGGGEVTLELGPRPLRAMTDLAVRVTVRGAPAAPEVSVWWSMRGMSMGENRSRLAPAGEGRFEGKGVLVRCPSGSRAWLADVELATPGAEPRTTRFALTLAE